MKFCRSCGSALGGSAAAVAAFAGARPVPQGPMPASVAALGGPMPGMPSGPVGGFPAGPPAGGGLGAGPVGGGPVGGLGGGAMARGGADALQPTMLPQQPGPIGAPLGGPSARGADALQPTMLPQSAPLGGSAALAGLTPGPLGNPAATPLPRLPQASTIACPRCGSQTPVGFAFCQQCGLHLEAIAATEAAPARPSAGVIGGQIGGQIGGSTSGRQDAPIDPHAGTLAQDDNPVNVVIRSSTPAIRPPTATGPAWGMAVLVNRDGSDGQRYPLTGEYLVIGRAGADIAFDDDRFLGRQHARLERGADGTVRVHPIDALNGVFRKTDAPVELVDGMTILVGREVLRFEQVEAEEAKVYPLVRHGVALFGSPPREPWGRLMQVVPSGGHRDVRHLIGDEVVLGREEGDIVFRDDAFLSRRHAAVTWDGKRAQITDLGSSNGTFVRITGPTALRNGDHVRMGDQLLRIELGR